MNLKESVIKALCCTMSFVILLGTAGCGKTDDEEKKQKKVIKKIVVVENQETEDEDDGLTQDESSSGNRTDMSQNSSNQDHVRRALYEKSTDTKYVETFEPEFSSKNVSWDGPEGYVIIYSDQCKYSYASAKKLQAFFATKDGVSLEIKKDVSVGEQAKEILVGNTNRYSSVLPVNQFAVNLIGSKLTFEGGHFAMVEKAADWFMTVERSSGKVAVISGTSADFKPMLADGYEYVWGDEFDGTGLDNNKWITNKKMMLGSPKLLILDGAEAEKEGVTAVADGRLKLTAKRYFNQLSKEAQYATSELCTFDTMNYVYGYAEIRARLPMYKGAWPSWWMTTAYCPELFPAEYTYDSVPYRLEVDIFEIFSSATTLIPNFHKWWTGNKAYKNPAGLHTAYPVDKKQSFVYPENDNLKNEYHTYGFKWTPDLMTMSVDGIDYTTFDLKNGFDSENEYNEFMQQPLQMIFNNYLFVDDTTAMDPTGKIIDPDDLPVEYFVDYVRLYQIPGEGKLWTKSVD